MGESPEPAEIESRLFFRIGTRTGESVDKSEPAEIKSRLFFRLGTRTGESIETFEIEMSSAPLANRRGMDSSSGDTDIFGVP